MKGPTGLSTGAQGPAHGRGHRALPAGRAQELGSCSLHLRKDLAQLILQGVSAGGTFAVSSEGLGFRTSAIKCGFSTSNIFSTLKVEFLKCLKSESNPPSSLWSLAFKGQGHKSCEMPGICCMNTGNKRELRRCRCEGGMVEMRWAGPKLPLAICYLIN